MGWGQVSLLVFDRDHTHAVHERWAEKCVTPRYRTIGEHSRRWHARVAELAAEGLDEAAARIRADSEVGEPDWIADQCGGCRFYVKLEGALGMDWGACTNPASEWDGTLKFEHDGCAAFGADPEAVTPELLAYLEGEVRSARTELDLALEERAM